MINVLVSGDVTIGELSQLKLSLKTLFKKEVSMHIEAGTAKFSCYSASL